MRIPKNIYYYNLNKLNKLQISILDTLQDINKNNLNEINTEKLYEELRCLFKNIYGNENDFLARFDKIKFMTEETEGVKVSKNNILYKKGLLYNSYYDNRFSFKNNIYTYDIQEDKEGNLYRTNFKIKEQTTKFEKNNMFDLNGGNDFFIKKKRLVSFDFQNEVIDLLYKINEQGFNVVDNNTLITLTRDLDIYDLNNMLEKIGNLIDDKMYHFNITKNKDEDIMISCGYTGYNEDIEEGIDEYTGEPTNYGFFTCDFEKNKFININNHKNIKKIIFDTFNNIDISKHTISNI